VKACPSCKARSARRLFGAGAGFLFKGSGFYQTDYRSDSFKAGEKSDSGGGGCAKPDCGSGGCGDVNAEAPRCPTCRGPLPPRDAVENGGRRDAPFCSERCRMVDLGRWLTGSFRIAGDPIDPSELPDAPGEPRS
jgi:endogenous inhibitor of DNA gyrase (YacG/DUF329 family)